MKKFWNWVTDQDGDRTLRLEGPIDSENVWGDEVTPAWFRSELEAGEGDVTVWINSPGGNVFAAAEIYTMLRDYRGKVTVKIDAIAASAASVIAMAGDTVLMSPVAMLMVHDPATVAMGNAADMQKAIDTLNEVKESIINAYMAKSSLSHNKIARLMSDETWLNAKKCLDMGFCDEILFSDAEKKNPFGSKEDDPDTDSPDEDHPKRGNPDKDEPEKDNPDEDPDEEKKKGVHLMASIYSSKRMDWMILNALGIREPDGKHPALDSQNEVTGKLPAADENASANPNNPASTVTDTAPNGGIKETAQDTPKETAPQKKEPASPVIGMDGRTEDGSVPFLILEKQLECLK